MQTSDVDKIVGEAVREALKKRSVVTNAHHVTLAAAQAVIKSVFAAAQHMGLGVYAAVADGAGNPVAVLRGEGALAASYDIAVNKAYTCTALKMSTEKLASLAAPGGELYGIQFTNGGKIVVFGGGEPLWHDGEIVGALGVSGGTLAQDIELAKVGKKYWEDILCR